MYRFSHAVALVIVVGAAAAPLAAQGVRSAPARPAAPAEGRCTASAEGTPGGVLARVAQAMGLRRDDNRVLRVRGWNNNVNDFQSDRTYAPFFSSYQSTEMWFDPRGGGMNTRTRGGAFPRAEAPAGSFAIINGTWANWAVRDTLVRATGNGADSRGLNPWAVVRDFLRPGEARMAGRCWYRDYPRLALTRTGIFGAETLLVDPKTMVPVGLVRTEPHYLWGQVHAEYVWSNWDEVTGGGLYPLTAFRQLDGALNLGTTATDLALVTADSAPRLAIPDTALRAAAVPPAFSAPPAPDTVRVGPETFLLVNPSYTVTVTLQRDTVFVLDATLGEARARQDADWVGRLFPGPHPVVVVVTDLAWPHIAGVRTWVAMGATIVSHRASEAFLRRIVDRRWTVAPDLLEQRRGRARFTFRAVNDSLPLAGGALVLHAIDGISSEAALMGWLPNDRFLWASDYIQNVRSPSEYAREVLRATRRVGIVPERFAAEHVRLTPWRTIDSLLADEPPAGSADTPDGAQLAVGRLAKHAALVRGGQSEDRGERVQQLVRGSYRGRPALISVQVFDTPQGPAIDSSYADAATLAPFRHSGRHATRTMELNFDGSRVTGRYAPAGETALAIDQAMDSRPYDSSLFDLVFAALPLRDGYAARLPFYIYEQGGAPVWYEGRVTGSETVALRDGTTADAWILDVSEEGRPRARFWVTRSGPREVVRSVHYISPGMEYTLTR